MRKDKEIASLEEKLKWVNHQRGEDQRVQEARQKGEDQRLSKEEQLSHHVNETIRKTQIQIDELTQNMKKRHDIYNKTLAQKNEEIKLLQNKLADAEKHQDKNDDSPKEELLANKISQIIEDTQRQTKEMRQSMEKRRDVYEKELSKKDKQIASLEEKLQKEEERRNMELLGFEQSVLVNNMTQVVNEMKKQQAHQVGEISREMQVQLDNMRQSIQESKKLHKKELFEQERNIASIEKKYSQDIKEVRRTLTETTDNLLTKLNEEKTKLRAAIDSVQNWETVAVAWEISDFESALNSDSTTVFESKKFSILNHTMNLELHIMNSPDSKEKYDHDVGFFFRYDDNCTLLTKEAMKGSTVALTRENGTLNHYFGTSSDFTYKTPDYRFGWKRIAKLNDILKNYVSMEGSITIEAFLRTKKMKRCDVSERNQIAFNVRTEK